MQKKFINLILNLLKLIKLVQASPDIKKYIQSQWNKNYCILTLQSHEKTSIFGGSDYMTFDSLDPVSFFYLYVKHLVLINER